jgi:ABC-2 type transport system permease protein
VNPALLFLLRRSAANAFRAKLRRLKSPRYLVPTVLGAGYFLLLLDPFDLRGRPRRFSPSAAAAGEGLAWEFLLAMGLVLLCTLSWVLPVRGSPLAFLEPEVAHLFPAPVTRKDLVRYKLLDLQKYLIFLPVIIGLLNMSRQGPVRAAFLGIGAWLGFTALSLHGIGAKMTRLSLAEHGWSGVRRALVPFFVVASYLAFVILTVPPLPEISGPANLGRDLDPWFVALDRSPAGWALYPFRLVVRPLFTTEFLPFLLRAGGLSVLVAALYVWVMRTDVAFEEAAAAQAESLALRIDAAKKGKFSAADPGRKVRKNPIPLSPTGPPETAFVWKSVAESLRGLSPRLLVFVFITIAIAVPISLDLARGRGEAGEKMIMVAAILMGAGAGLLVFAGPAAVGVNLRQDLEKVEVLKTFPLTGARLVRCSLAGTLVPVAALQALLVVGGVLLFPSPDKVEFTPAWRVAVAFAGVLFLPAMTAISAAVDAAGVLYFPAWVKPGQQQVQGGMEGMGYGIVTGVVKILALALGLLVPAGLGSLLSFGTIAAGGSLYAPAAVVAGAVLGTALLGVEVWLLSLVLGRRFEAFDPAEEGLVA